MKGYTLMVISALFFGTQGIFIKLAGSADIPVMTLNFYRMIIAFATLAVIVPFFDRNTYKVTKSDIREYSLIGFLFAISTTVFTAAMMNAPVKNVVLINYTYPFFITILGAALLKEKITKVKIITLGVAFIGMIILNPIDFDSYGFGNMLAFLHAILYALLIMGERKEDQKHGIGDVVWFFMFASLFMLPMPFIFGFGDVVSTFGYVLLMGIFGTAACHLFLNLALEHIEAYMSSIIDLIVTPIASIILAALVLGEVITLNIVIGGALLITAGTYLQTHNKKVSTKS